MSRFSSRQPQWSDVIGRFEAKSFSEHLHNALGLVGRLKDEGREFWGINSPQLRKWNRSCDEMWSFLNTLRKRRDVDAQPLETAMREFIHTFEHSTGRMYQLLYGTASAPATDARVRAILQWFNLVFLSSTYALLSAWSADKQDTNTLTTTVNLNTGEVRTEGTRTEMRVPRRLKKFTQDL